MEGLIGPDKAIDTNEYFVVCANVLGGCQGTTGPSSIDPETGKPYGPTFPQVTIRDIVRTQHMLMNHLDLPHWLSVVGGSMGGMQVLEWGAMYPDLVKSLIPVASVAAASPQQIGWSAVERMAIVQDPKWRDGWYYDAEPGDGPWHGLALAREISQITYRTTEVFDDRFGREPVSKKEELQPWGRYQVESYLDHHGQKLVRRFDANSFLVLSKAMDLHDVGRGRAGSSGSSARSGCRCSRRRSPATSCTRRISRPRSMRRSPPAEATASITSSRVRRATTASSLSRRSSARSSPTRFSRAKEAAE